MPLTPKRSCLSPIQTTAVRQQLSILPVPEGKEVAVVLILFLSEQHIEHSFERQYLLQLSSTLSMGNMRRQYQADLIKKEEAEAANRAKRIFSPS